MKNLKKLQYQGNRSRSYRALQLAEQNLVPDDDRKVLRRTVCVKLKDDIYSPGEMNGQMMALKKYMKARYRLSDPIRAQKNDKMTINLSK